MKMFSSYFQHEVPIKRVPTPQKKNNLQNTSDERGNQNFGFLKTEVLRFTVFIQTSCCKSGKIICF